MLGQAALSGGLFNQIWALQGLVMHAANNNRSMLLPTFDSHLFASSMGERDTEATKPRRHSSGKRRRTHAAADDQARVVKAGQHPPHAR